MCEDSEGRDAKLLKEQIIRCAQCAELITDKYVLRIKDEFWHPTCLKCAVCQQELGSKASCYMKAGKVFCKDDYARQYRVKYAVNCSCCQRAIQETDWVRKAKQHVYHLACFACEVCKRQLSTGEEFALIDHKLLCKLHYIEKLESPLTPSSNNVGPMILNSSGNDSDISSHSSSVRDSLLPEEEEEKVKRKANDKFGISRSKRVRTSFTDEQLQILQANFEIDPNPDAAELERVSQLTGLSKRVTQVWFQNSRARQKKQGSFNRLVASSPSGNP